MVRGGEKVGVVDGSAHRRPPDAGGGGRGGKAEKVHFITYCPGGDWRGCARWKFSVVYCPEAIGQAEGSFFI